VTIFCPERCDIRRTEATSAQGLKLATPREGSGDAKGAKSFEEERWLAMDQ